MILKHLNIKLVTIEDTKEFYHKAFEYEELYLHQNKTQIPANSFMGLFTLDWNSPVKLVFPNDDASLIERITNDFGKWIVKE